MSGPLHRDPASETCWAAELSRLRERVDEVDRRLLDLLARRGALVQQLAELKRAAGLPLRDPAREAELIAGLRARNPGPYADDELVAILREVLAASRALMTRQAGD